MIRFRVISGTVNVTENCYLYEYLPDGQNVAEMILVDCGVAFPELGMHGVDLIIPDFSYIIENKEKLKGIVVSQGHEDHQGALPFLLTDIKTTVYAPKLVANFIEDKFKDQNLAGYSLKEYDPANAVLKLGVFTITPFRVSHSIPETVGFAIDTPEGRFMHVAEHKFDPEPASGSPFDIEKAKELAKPGIVALASDCVGVNVHGSTPPEKPIKDEIDKIVSNSKGRIFFTCISSSISRVQQAIEVAEKNGRKVAFIGRSIERKSLISHDLGYLKYDERTVVKLHEIETYNPDKIMYIAAGAFGQVGSSLFRIALNEHKFVSAYPGDTVIMEQDPAPPYTKESIDFVVDNFIDMGLEVHYYDINEKLHVSGHGGQDDITRLFDMMKPKYFIPLGGTIRFMHSFKKLVEKWGASSDMVYALKPGESVDFKQGTAKRGTTIKVKQILVDGTGVGDVGKTVLSDRKALAEDGVAVVLVKVDPHTGRVLELPEIISRGFVFEKQEKDFLSQSAKALEDRLNRAKKLTSKTAHYITIEFFSEYFFTKIKRRPLIIPVVTEG